MSKVINVNDRRFGWIGTWWTMPLSFEELEERDVGRTVIYRDDHGKCEAGTLTGWNDQYCFVRYSVGSTAAATSPGDLVFGTWPCDGERRRALP